MERFDIFNARMNEPSAPVASVEVPQPPLPTNGHYDSPASMPDAATPQKRSAGSDDISDIASGSPRKKKRKPSVDADALFAAKLQAEEDKLARPTRGSNSRKSAPAKKKKTPKKKTSARVKASDDSDIDDSESGEKKPPKNTGFHVSSAASTFVFKVSDCRVEADDTFSCPVCPVRRRNYCK
jgi:hypothetical protein